MGHYNSFIVRVWSDGTDGTVRGHIQHVGTHDEAYFSSLDRMVDFIMSHLGPVPNHIAQTEADAEDAIILFRDMRIPDE